ncbi:MAG: Gx transporter family protein [Clostridia bacterium]|nr:Gx transporter family protein [Clostridia bacterium]
MSEKTKKLTFLALSCTLALMLSYIESLLPPVVTSVPGIKMGLANLVIITVLYLYGLKEAAAVSLLRLVMTFLLFGNPLTALYSLAGAVISLLAMALFKRLRLFSTVGVSVTGGVLHNLGQILVAIVLFDSLSIGYYMLILTLTGTLAGALIGITASFLIKRLENVYKHHS